MPGGGTRTRTARRPPDFKSLQPSRLVSADLSSWLSCASSDGIERQPPLRISDGLVAPKLPQNRRSGERRLAQASAHAPGRADLGCALGHARLDNGDSKMIAHSRIEGSQLAGNLLGDPSERDLFVYLPPGYEKSERRYRTAYLLARVRRDRRADGDARPPTDSGGGNRSRTSSTRCSAGWVCHQ